MVVVAAAMKIGRVHDGSWVHLLETGCSMFVHDFVHDFDDDDDDGVAIRNSLAVTAAAAVIDGSYYRLGRNVVVARKKTTTAVQLPVTISVVVFVAALIQRLEHLCRRHHHRKSYQSDPADSIPSLVALERLDEEARSASQFELVSRQSCCC